MAYWIPVAGSYLEVLSPFIVQSKGEIKRVWEAIPIIQLINDNKLLESTFGPQFLQYISLGKHFYISEKIKTPYIDQHF